MGGAESLYTGLNAIDRFAWIGAFSSGGLSEDFDATFPPRFESKRKATSALDRVRHRRPSDRFRQWCVFMGAHQRFGVPSPCLVWRR